MWVTLLVVLFVIIVVAFLLCLGCELKSCRVLVSSSERCMQTYLQSTPVAYCLQPQKIVGCSHLAKRKSSTILRNLLVAQLNQAYASIYIDMQGYAREGLGVNSTASAARFA